MALVTAAVIAAVGGAALSGAGASKRAKETRKAQEKGIKQARALADQFTTESKELKSTKLGILGSSQDVFGRLGGFIFGDTDSLESLREAQSEFSALAAGDTRGFTREVESMVKGALSSTSGLPTGAFENLSARNLLNFRSQGLQNALSLTTQISGLGSSLINTEFGIHDQDFETRLRLRENELDRVTQLNMGVANTRGTEAAALGNVFTTAAGSVFSIGNQQQQSQFSDQYLNLLSQQASAGGATNRAVPVYSQPTFTPGGTTTPIVTPSYTPPSLPSGQGGTNPLLFSQPSISFVGQEAQVAPIQVGQGVFGANYLSIE